MHIIGSMVQRLHKKCVHFHSGKSTTTTENERRKTWAYIMHPTIFSYSPLGGRFANAFRTCLRIEIKPSNFDQQSVLNSSNDNMDSLAPINGPAIYYPIFCSTTLDLRIIDSYTDLTSWTEHNLKQVWFTPVNWNISSATSMWSRRSYVRSFI